MADSTDRTPGAGDEPKPTEHSPATPVIPSEDQPRARVEEEVSTTMDKPSAHAADAAPGVTAPTDSVTGNAAATGGDAAAQATVTVTVRVRRFDPEEDSKPFWQDFEVSAYATDRILDLLHKIKWEQDGSLTFRRSCGHGICGSDAIRINGRNRLACKTLVKDLNADKPITIEAIKGLPLEKDLVVDMKPFFAAYREVKPFLIPAGHEPTRERVQTVEQRARFDDTTKCILCAACTTSCPVFWNDEQYFGPAAIVNAHRFIFDSRDSGAAERLDIVNDAEGVWRCRTAFNCTEACPRGIEVTKAIQEVKRALVFRKG